MSDHARRNRLGLDPSQVPEGESMRSTRRDYLRDLSEQDIATFWAFSDRSSGPTACWPWLRAQTSNGYGQFNVQFRKCARAHRLAYELVIGPIPSGLVIDHTCGNRLCINPAHLEPVTPRENVRRGGSGQARSWRARGLCVQCQRLSVTYRCGPCREIHNANNKGRKR